ncbi:hypothetical protein PDR5_01540 [Pseudomonas sp. DR 5-09]|nr:hypothetical protein PDR5_01540 [Pseudomonas sp. DR 5-09]
MWNDFSRAGNDTGWADFRILGNSDNRFAEAVIHIYSGFWVYGVKIIPNLFTFLCGGFRPDNLHS